MKSAVLITVAAVVLAFCGCGQNTKPTQPIQTAQESGPTGSESKTDVAAPEKDENAEGGETDAMTMYRQAQLLMKEGREEEGYETAKKAMQQFISEDNDLAWMLLDSIGVEGGRVDVHFNMGPSERNPPDNGIIRPLSFRVWSRSGDETIREVLDFEIGRVDGEPLTAAIGKTHASGHSNYGILPVNASYEMIIQAVLKVVEQNSSNNN